MQLAASSCIMIGIQGAGLQWSVFMPHGCTLIEIAWPSKHWGFYFHNYVKAYGITYFRLRASARVNWTAYERNVCNGTKVGDLRMLLLHFQTWEFDVNKSRCFMLVCIVFVLHIGRSVQ